MATVFFLLIVNGLQAEMITVGGDQTAGTGTLTINQDLDFTILSNHTGLILFTFDEVVVEDADYTQAVNNFSGLEFSVNGGTAHSITKWVDNMGGPWGSAFTANDGYIYGLDSVSLSPGDIVTLHSGTGTMTETQAGFNPWGSGTYNAFLVDGSGNRFSDVVPEPATAGLLGLSAIGLAFYRKLSRRWM